MVARGEGGPALQAAPAAPAPAAAEPPGLVRPTTRLITTTTRMAILIIPLALALVALTLCRKGAQRNTLVMLSRTRTLFLLRQLARRRIPPTRTITKPHIMLPVLVLVQALPLLVVVVM